MLTRLLNRAVTNMRGRCVIESGYGAVRIVA
jgi:hypothetical protein